MTTGRLAPVSYSTWEETGGAPGIDHWLWCDTAGEGLHIESALGAAPADVTHVWGWNSAHTSFVRLRVDLDLGYGSTPGIVGARLDLTAEGATPVTVRRGQTWDPLDGRINVDPGHQAFQGARLLDLYEVYVDRADTGAKRLQAPLTFLALSAELR